MVLGYIKKSSQSVHSSFNSMPSNSIFSSDVASSFSSCQSPCLVFLPDFVRLQIRPFSDMMFDLLVKLAFIFCERWQSFPIFQQLSMQIKLILFLTTQRFRGHYFKVVMLKIEQNKNIGLYIKVHS